MIIKRKPLIRTRFLNAVSDKVIGFMVASANDVLKTAVKRLAAAKMKT
jgi:hypothetical protein